MYEIIFAMQLLESRSDSPRLGSSLTCHCRLPNICEVGRMMGLDELLAMDSDGAFPPAPVSFNSPCELR